MVDTVSPRIDLAFKKIFGVEENKDLLISLINSIVSKQDQVVDVDILNPYNPRNFRKDKLSILDIKAKDTKGQRYNIEIQLTDEEDYDKRALYYWAKLYSEQLEARGKYSSLRKAIGIHILNFISIPESKKYYNAFHITEKESGIRYFTDMELHTIELSKFEQDTTLETELSEYLLRVKNALDIWALFLTRHDLLKPDGLPKEIDNPNLRKAIQVLEELNFDKYEREEYNEHLKWFRMEASSVEKSIAKGRAEEKTEIVKTMLRKNMDIKLISEVTKLSEDEIKKISQEVLV